MIDSEPSMALGDSWWSMIAVQPRSRASTAPNMADHRIDWSSSARSSRHHTSSKISVNPVGVRGGVGMPRASAE